MASARLASGRDVRVEVQTFATTTAGLLALSKDTTQATLMGVTAAEQEAMMQDLLLARNAAWIPGIEAAAAKGPSFVAVGALHLLGPGSVIERLEAKGWAIARTP